jgi:glycosyltransferase 2 family protein
VKFLSVFAGLLGFCVIAALVVYFGPGAITRPLVAVGWTGFATISLIHVALIGVMGIAWAALLPGTPWWVPIWGRLTRDSGSEVLPLSQVGGYVLGARAVSLAGVSGTSATASTIVDVTLELFGQLGFTALALCCLLYLRPDTAIAAPLAAGLAAAGLIAALFLVVQRRGVEFLDRFARMLGRGWADKTAEGAATLHSALTGIYGNRAGVLLSFLLHLACWIASTLEPWLALRFAGAPLGFATVLVIEGLLYAARSVAFAVPNAVGVQEGAYILLGAGFGLTPEVALALSLLKRGRDVAIGLPALAVWQLAESGRLWRRAARTRPGRFPFKIETPAATTGGSPPPAEMR